MCLCSTYTTADKNDQARRYGKTVNKNDQTIGCYLISEYCLHDDGVVD